MMQVVISKWGNSSAIRLPKQLMKRLQLQPNDILDYKTTGDKIILEKAGRAPELTVEELFRGYKGKPVNTTPVVFKSTGNERW